MTSHTTSDDTDAYGNGTTQSIEKDAVSDDMYSHNGKATTQMTQTDEKDNFIVLKYDSCMCSTHYVRSTHCKIYDLKSCEDHCIIETCLVKTVIDTLACPITKCYDISTTTASTTTLKPNNFTDNSFIIIISILSTVFVVATVIGLLLFFRKRFFSRQSQTGLENESYVSFENSNWDDLLNEDADLI